MRSGFMIRVRSVTAAIFLLCLSFVGQGSAQTYIHRRVHASLSAGIGFPKVPFSIYYPPVSICGGLSGSVDIAGKLSVRADVLALHTYNIGTVTGEKRDLRLDLSGGSIDLMYRLDRSLFGRQFICAGFGRYTLTQEIDNTAYSREVSGIKIGLARWVFRRRFSTLIDFSWLLLLEPSPRPQVLLITLGAII